MIRIHANGFQMTANSDLTGWAIESTRDGLQTVAGGDFDQPTRAALFAGGRRAVEAWLREKLYEVTGR